MNLALPSKPVKGMLTGPVAILKWSSPRIDISREIQAIQIGLAIRDAILDFEKIVFVNCFSIYTTRQRQN